MYIYLHIYIICIEPKSKIRFQGHGCNLWIEGLQPQKSTKQVLFLWHPMDLSMLKGISIRPLLPCIATEIVFFVQENICSKFRKSFPNCHCIPKTEASRIWKSPLNEKRKWSSKIYIPKKLFAWKTCCWFKKTINTIGGFFGPSFPMWIPKTLGPSGHPFEVPSLHRHGPGSFTWFTWKWPPWRSRDPFLETIINQVPAIKTLESAREFTESGNEKSLPGDENSTWTPQKRPKKRCFFITRWSVVCKDYLPKIDMPPKQVTI